ncbi:MAG: hypothetical protein IAE89_13020 [Anaerolineae bacterium]|nr:hypothetical protein [Anaerolineae bacterium]
MTRRIHALFAVCLICIVSACGSLGGADTKGTLQAEATAFVDASTQIAQTSLALATSVNATAAMARTEIGFIDGMNAQLAQTLRAAVPPTQQIVSNQGPVTPGFNSALPGQFTPSAGGSDPGAEGNVQTGETNQFAQVGVATGVHDSDGCATAIQTQVSSSTSRLYATARILNAAAGTQLSVTWMANGQVVYTNSAYSLPQDDSDFCLWFYIEPTDVSFATGEWSIQFLINGQPVGSPSAFTMTG